MTENDNAQNCQDKAVEEKVSIIKLRTRIQNLEAEVKDLKRYVAVIERDYKRSLSDHWSIEEREASWQGYLDGK